MEQLPIDERPKYLSIALTTGQNNFLHTVNANSFTFLKHRGVTFALTERNYYFDTNNSKPRYTTMKTTNCSWDKNYAIYILVPEYDVFIHVSTVSVDNETEYEQVTEALDGARMTYASTSERAIAGFMQTLHWLDGSKPFTKPNTGYDVVSRANGAKY
jgi:hypothetical protein